MKSEEILNYGSMGFVQLHPYRVLVSCMAFFYYKHKNPSGQRS